MKIILIDNYTPDRQESMRRFTNMLRDGFKQSGFSVTVWRPTVFFGYIPKTTLSGFGKWLGYIDKWLLFPVVLFFRGLFLSKEYHYHICDHSNSAYLNPLPKSRTSITCHDVLAIRGALGFKDAYCEASAMGKVLQNSILKNLLKTDKIASVSHLTHNQLTDLNNGKSKPNWTVIHNGFNAGFVSLKEEEWQQKLREHNMERLINKPYIVHVGSNLPRKNRKMLLLMVDKLGAKWDGLICFTGQPMDSKLKQLAQELNLTDRIVEIKKPDHKYLEALICGAQVFVFPSYSEGFGWPVIEAQACGTPVLASHLEPMPEVGGNGALYANPDDADSFAAKFLEIINPSVAERLVASGFENTKRFDTDVMIKAYLNFFTI